MTYGYGSVHSNGMQVIYQYCLGICKCPQPQCKFVRNPVAPRKKRVNGANPVKVFGSDKCLLHDALLLHVPCKATCTLICSNSSVTVRHSGKHKHDCPHEKVSKQAVARLDDIIHINTNAKPIQILQGTPTRGAARSIHPALNNLDRLSYYMRGSKMKITTLKLQNLGAWQETMGCDFLKRADCQAGIFIIQFPGMKEIAKTNVLYAFQTDTIEGWMYEQNNHNGMSQ
jgi:hypothetical protein